jgi:chemotaxis protein MotB
MKGLALAALVCVLAAGCVPKDKYDKLVVASAKAQAQADEKQKADDAQIAQLEAQIKDAEAQSQDRDAQIADLSTQKHNIQASLDEATAMNQELRGELERLGKDADKLLQEKGVLAKDLQDAKARLEELRRAQTAAEARTQLVASLTRKFKPMIDAGQCAVVTRNGRIAFVVPADLLFDAGKVEIKPASKGAVMEIAKALSDMGNRRFEVGVHTDNVRAKSARFPTSWDLTAARAAELVKYLVSLGVRSNELAATGYGEFDPVASNDAPDGRTKNRRIEFSLEPLPEEIVAR